MVLILLTATAQALTWYAATPGEAELLGAALDDVWPASGVSVQIGPPTPEIPGGAVWWDGKTLTLASELTHRQAAGVADPSVQVAMVRGWLSREPLGLDGPPDAPTMDDSLDLYLPDSPSPLRGLVQLSGGPTLRLPHQGASWDLTASFGGYYKHFGASSLIGVSLGESARDAGLTAGLIRWSSLIVGGPCFGPSRQVWLLGGVGVSDIWALFNGNFARSSAYVAAAGAQYLHPGDGLQVGARLLVSSDGQDHALVMEDHSFNAPPGAITLSLVLAKGTGP